MTAVSAPAFQLIQTEHPDTGIVSQVGTMHNRRELLQYKGYHAIISLFREPERG